MSSLAEISLPQQPEITHYRNISQNTSIYLVLGTRILETLSLHHFCEQSPYHQKLSSLITELIRQAQSRYSNIAYEAAVVDDILNIITAQARDVQLSLRRISGYAQNNESSAQISLVFKHILWTTSEVLANREYEHCMLEEVLKTYSAVFKIKIILLSGNGEKKCFYEQLSGRCPVMCLLDDESKIYSVYSREMLAIENGSETDLQVILQSPQMMCDVIPSPGARSLPNPVNPTNPAANYSSPGYGSFLQGDMNGRMQNTLPLTGMRSHISVDLLNPVGYSLPSEGNADTWIGNPPGFRANLLPQPEISHMNKNLQKIEVKPTEAKVIFQHSEGTRPIEKPPARGGQPIEEPRFTFGWQDHQPSPDFPSFAPNPQFPPPYDPRFMGVQMPSPVFHQPGFGTSPQIPPSYNPGGFPVQLLPPQPHPIPDGPSPPIARNMQENLPLPRIDDLIEGLVSKRTDISSLNLGPTITEELRCNYSHCIGICSSYNPITAFAEALLQFFKLESNRDIKKRIISSFQQKRNYSNLILDQSQNYNLTKDRVESLRETLMEISTQALTRAEEIDEEAKALKEMQLSVGNGIMFTQLCDGPHPDYFLLTILCKIFGFAAIVTEQRHNSQDFEKTQLNGRVLGYRPELHFISLKSDEGCNHLHVLLTNSHVFEDKFNIQEQRPAANRTIPHIIPNRSLDFPSKPPQVNETSPVDFLVELNRVQDRALESLRTCIARRIPLMMDTVDIDLKTGRLTDLTRLFDYPQFQQMYGFAEPQITQHKAIEYCQPCEYCSSKDSSPEVFCNIGCYYHGECLVEVFRMWYNKCEIKPIAEQSFSCRKCQKSIRLETFLATNSGGRFRETCLKVFEKKCRCCECGETKSIDEVEVYDRDCGSNLCPDCYALKVIRKEQSYYCNSGHLISVPKPYEAEYKCIYCKKETLLCNFIDYKDELLGGIACKRCWIDWCFQKNGLRSNMPFETMKAVFDADLIACVICNQESYRPYTDITCPNGCRICYEHFNGYKCGVCGLLCGEARKIPWSKLYDQHYYNG